MNRFILRAIGTALLGVIAATVTTPVVAAPSSDDIAQLRETIRRQEQLIRELTARVERLERPGAKEDDSGFPAIEIPKASPPQTARASFAPDISVVGNNTGRFLSVRGDADRNRLQLAEIELALEQPVYEGIRFRAILAGSAEERFASAFEEAYVSLLRVGRLPVSGTVGRKRIAFGRMNTVHPHARPFVDQPAVLSHLLATDGLTGNGASVAYQIPLRSAFASLEVGYTHTSQDAPVTVSSGGRMIESPTGLGADGNVTSARLWLAKQVSNAEVEVGLSHVAGRTANANRVSVTGLDLSLRRSVPVLGRLTLQTEAIWRRVSDESGESGGHTSSGWYALAQISPDQYSDYALRLDETSAAWPLPGRERSISLAWTNHLTEASALRLQYRFGDRSTSALLPSAQGFNEVLLQFLWGAGSHSHPLQ